jgi:hypothetical protein
MGDEKGADDENNMDHTMDDRLNDLLCQGTEGGREGIEVARSVVIVSHAVRGSMIIIPIRDD